MSSRLPVVRLGDYCEVDSGFAFKSERFSQNPDDINLVKGSNLGHKTIDWNEGPKWPKDEYEKLKFYELKYDDVVLAMDRPIVGGNLKFAWITESAPKALLVQRVARLRAKNGLKQKYLRYVIADSAFQLYIDTITTGANIPHISGPDIRDFKFHLPPIATQSKIATILSAYDDLIENNLKRIKLLEEMAQITYEEWFVRLKFPGHESTPVDSKTGLPVGFEIKKLGEVLSLNYGKSLTAEARSSGSIPVYGSAGIVGFHNESIVKGPGVIVGRKGNVGSIFWTDDDFYPIDTVFFVSSELPLLFIRFLLSYIEFVNNDAAVPALNRNAAYLIKCRIPTLSLIKQFSGFVTPLFKTIHNLKKQNQLLKEARDILLPRLMTGMIDVEQLDLPEPLGELSSNLTQEPQAA